METIEVVDIIEPLARKAKEIDERVTFLNAEIKELKSEREGLSDKIVAIMQDVGIDTSVGLRGGGVVKLETKPYVSVVDMESFVSWANESNIQLPNMQFNPATLNAWYAEQLSTSQPVPPEESVKPFWKTKVKVNAK
jgi:hypothetical protein